MENNNFFCHIIGINQVDKKKLYEFSFIKEFHIIDLDLINKDIFNNIDLKKMFKQFTHFTSLSSMRKSFSPFNETIDQNRLIFIDFKEELDKITPHSFSVQKLSNIGYVMKIF